MHPARSWEDKEYILQGTQMYEEKGKPESHPTYFRTPQYSSAVEHLGGLSTVEAIQSNALRALPAPMYHPPGYSGVPPFPKQSFPWGDIVNSLVSIEMSMHAGDVEGVVRQVNEFYPWFLALRAHCPTDSLKRLTELDTRLMAIEEWLGKYTNTGAFGYTSPRFMNISSPYSTIK